MNARERYEKVEEGLAQAVYHLSWLGEWWGSRGAIALEETRCWYATRTLGKKRVELLSTLSSTYYAAGGNARARAKRSFLTRPWWQIVACICLCRAKRLSDELVWQKSVFYMTPDELDVRSHILRRVGEYELALVCIHEALSRTDIHANSRALLLMGEGEVRVEQGDLLGAEHAYETALCLRNLVAPSTAVRLLRSYAVYRKECGEDDEARRLLDEAERLASIEGFSDQMEKIKAVRLTL